MAPYIISYIIKKNLEKFQQSYKKEKPDKKEKPEKDFKFKSKKDVGEYIDYEEVD